MTRFATIRIFRGEAPLRDGNGYRTLSNWEATTNFANSKPIIPAVIDDWETKPHKQSI